MNISIQDEEIEFLIKPENIECTLRVIELRDHTMQVLFDRFWKELEEKSTQILEARGFEKELGLKRENWPVRPTGQEAGFSIVPIVDGGQEYGFKYTISHELGKDLIQHRFAVFWIKEVCENIPQEVEAALIKLKKQPYMNQFKYYEDKHLIAGSRFPERKSVFSFLEEYVSAPETVLEPFELGISTWIDDSYALIKEINEIMRNS